MLENLFGRPGRTDVPVAALAELRAYWEGLRQGGSLPARAAVDPRGIAGVLDCAFLAERIAPGQARFRIAGMQLAEMAGMDVRGLPLMVLLTPADRAAFAAALEQVFSGPAIVETWLEAERGIGRPELRGRLLLLPLADDGGAATRALGVLATAGTIGRSPRRFAMTRRTVTRILLPDPAVETAATALAETPAPCPVPPRAAPGRAHLRLLTFDRRDGDA